MRAPLREGAKCAVLIYGVAAVQLRDGRTSLPSRRPAMQGLISRRGSVASRDPRLCLMQVRGFAWQAESHGISLPPGSTVLASVIFSPSC